MKKLINSMKKAAFKAGTFLAVQRQKMSLTLANNRGEGYIDSAIKILIAVVLGGLLLAGLYLLFEDSLLPELQRRIMSMFDYAG